MIDQDQQPVSTIAIKRCAIGEQLHQDWLDALESQNCDFIYHAMQRYFFHRNGTPNKHGGKISPPCPDCTLELVNRSTP